MAIDEVIEDYKCGAFTSVYMNRYKLVTNRNAQQNILNLINACKEALKEPAWQGLTDDELSHLKYLHVDYELFDEGEYGTECNVYVDDFAKAIEQELKTKNGFSGLKDKNT